MVESCACHRYVSPRAEYEILVEDDGPFVCGGCETRVEVGQPYSALLVGIGLPEGTGLSREELEAACAEVGETTESIPVYELSCVYCAPLQQPLEAADHVAQ